MFDTIRNPDGSTVIRCLVSDREWISNGQLDREQTLRIAEQMQRVLLYDKLGYDPKQPKTIEYLRAAYQHYKAKVGK
jgi:hypothetical protein